MFSSEKLGLENVIKKGVEIRGKKRDIIITPKVIETAKDYFDCDSIQGLELEDEGSKRTRGYHWEQGLLFFELMTVTTYRRAKSFSQKSS